MGAGSSSKFFTDSQNTHVENSHLINIAGDQNINHNHIYTPRPSIQLQKEAQNALYEVIARNAMHDGNQRAADLEFYPNTQKIPLTEITSWVLDPQRLENILWLKGAVGTGKSALSKKIADMLHNGEVNGQLAASFFFLRKDPTRNHPGKFAVTIAYRLTVSFPDVGERIGAAITRDRTLLTAEITHQWAELVVKPVKEILTSTLPTVIVIDGLDECGTAANQGQVLELISSCGPDFPIAFLITSRPEPHLSAAFENLGGCAAMDYRTIELGDNEETRAEMKAFLDHSFSNIRSKHPMAFPSGVEWPDEQTINKILDWASGRYLHLSTIIQSVSSDEDPRAALEKVLDKAPIYNKPVTLRKLVLAIDIGTTYSGVSYSILEPCTTPTVRSVTRFPGQDGNGGDSRIPSTIIYDQFGTVQAVGAETDNSALQMRVEDENWFKADWFKLHLRPKDLALIEVIPPLPPNKTVMVIFADFLRYIVECTRQFIIDSHVNGTVIWESHKEFVLTHPNGWGRPQQYQMREAAVMAGIVPDSREGRESVHFVTEGEASLHYCLSNKILPHDLTTQDGVLIIDAGGGTIDTSAYRKQLEDKASYEEVAIPQCFLQGSVMVAQRAHSHFEKHLTGSKYSDDIPVIVSTFNNTTKLKFKNSDQLEYIHFGTLRDNDSDYNIRNGKLKLDGATIAGFFEPSIKCMESVIEQSHLEHRIKTVLLVGGFAANEWVFKSLKATFDPRGVSIYRPDHRMAKAVADGAVSYFLESYVKFPISKCACGTIFNVYYDPGDPEHILRKSQLSTYPGGALYFANCFDMFLPKNIRVTEEQQQYHRPYQFIKSTYEEVIVSQYPIQIYGYFGELARPLWMSENQKDYWVIGQIPLDTTDVKHFIRKGTTPSGGDFYAIYFDIIFLFSLKGLGAQIGWKESENSEIKQRSRVYEICDQQQVYNYY